MHWGYCRSRTWLVLLLPLSWQDCAQGGWASLSDERTIPIPNSGPRPSPRASRVLCLASPPLIDACSQWTASSSPDLFDDSNLPSIPAVLAIGLSIGLAAQLWINRLTQGDGGLGSFLQDGRGYSKSGFVFNDENRAVSNDPLPWLKLPKLDFVDVAGQEVDVMDSEDDGRVVLDRLQALEEELESAIGRGDYAAAKILKVEIEKLVSDNSGRLRRTGER